MVNWEPKRENINRINQKTLVYEEKSCIKQWQPHFPEKWGIKITCAIRHVMIWPSLLQPCAPRPISKAKPSKKTGQNGDHLPNISNLLILSNYFTSVFSSNMTTHNRWIKPQLNVLHVYIHNLIGGNHWVQVFISNF